MRKTVSMQRLLAALLAVLLLCPMAACKKQEVDIGQWEAEEKERVYSSLVSGQYYDLDGRYFYLHDTGLYERPIVISFWKMDRPESLEALPAFQKAFERYGGKVQFLMICTYSENDGNGSEDTKGGALRREAYALLSEAKEAGRMNFVGNVEARDAFSGDVDVIVADGFSGNVLLKAI